jgi:uncharacterized surface protein with fasciclin (FAS1) repeats
MLHFKSEKMRIILALFTSFAVATDVASASFLRAGEDQILSVDESKADSDNEDASLLGRVLSGPARRLHGVWYWLDVSRPVRVVPVSRSEDLVETAIDSGLSTLVELLGVADLTEVLQSEGPLTLMAPTNSAFNALPAATLAALRANTTLLANILSYHVLPFQELRTIGNQWRGGGPFPTAAQGGPGVTTSRYRAGRRGPLVKKVNGARVVTSDILASNGVLHIIDSVLLPPEGTTPPVASPSATAAPGPADGATPAPGPAGGATPAPGPAGGATPAPGPAPGPGTPAPGPGTPAPGPGTPAPGPDTPAPGPATPAPGPATPAPGPATPAPGPATPAPGPATPAPGPA